MMENNAALIQLNFMNVITIIVIAAVGFYAMGAVSAFFKSRAAA